MVYWNVRANITAASKCVKDDCLLSLLFVIEVFGGVCVLSFGFLIFCWYRGFCHRTGSDLLLFLLMPLFPVSVDKMTYKYNVTL